VSRPRVPLPLEVGVAALAWAVLVVGLSVLTLTTPAYTADLTRILGVPATSGLSAADVSRLSDQVRALVADDDYDPLPAVWKGRPAFDQAAVSHLLDVRRVLAGARGATGVTAALLVIYFGWGIATGRLRRLRLGMLWAGGVLVVVVALAALAALVDFESFFAAFHGLFFAAGTWTFPADSMLIQLFPERFWAASGAAWAALCVLGGLVLAVASWALRAVPVNKYASRTPDNV
jgi:integral membrane protein (TIGR01906 family)